jgi:hypothetical protein
MTGRRPLIVRITQMETAVVEDTVPGHNHFPTYKEEKRDRSEPQFRGSSEPGGSSRPACTSAPAESLAAILQARRAGACSFSTETQVRRWRGNKAARARKQTSCVNLQAQ